jgi:hypothetical protein
MLPGTVAAINPQLLKEYLEAMPRTGEDNTYVDGC